MSGVDIVVVFASWSLLAWSSPGDRDGDGDRDGYGDGDGYVDGDGVGVAVACLHNLL